MINAETLRYVTRLTTIRYIISLHDDAKCNNELPAPTGTAVFHFALTSRAESSSDLLLSQPYLSDFHEGDAGI